MLRRQGELLKSLEPVSAVLAQLKEILNPANASLPSEKINDVGQALIREAQKGSPDDCIADATATATATTTAAGAAPKSEVFARLNDRHNSPLACHVQ